MQKRKTISQAIRKDVYKKCFGHCAYCGCKLKYEEMQVDHYAPVHLFGDNTALSNLMPACRMCNKYKSTYTIQKFREQLEQLVVRLRRDSFIFRLSEKFKLVSSDCTHSIIFFYEELQNIARNNIKTASTQSTLELLVKESGLDVCQVLEICQKYFS